MIDKTITKQKTPWHSLTTEQTETHFDVNAHTGLEQKEVANRLTQFGANAILAKERRGWWSLLLAQFSDFMILVLIAAAIISGVIGEPEDAIAIVVIITLNAVIGFIQNTLIFK